MRSAALTLMALAVLSACAETTDAVAPASNAGVYYPAYNGTTNSTTENGTPFFTTDPAYFANPPAYSGDPGVLAIAPYYTGNIGYFVVPNGRARNAYCPPRGGRGYSHARVVGHHR